MAEVAIVSAVLQGLAAAAQIGVSALSQRGLIGSHKLLINGVKDKMDGIKRDMEKIQSILKSADQEDYDDEMVDAWVKDVRDVSFKLEDILDLHIYAMSDPGDGRGVLWGAGKRYKRKLQILASYRTTEAELEKIKPHVEEITKVFQSRIERSFGASGRSDLALRSPSSSSRCHPSVVRSMSIEEDASFSLSEHGATQKEMVEQWILEVPPEQENIAADTLDPRWRAIAMWGMGGLGKSTLLRRIFYQNSEIRSQFNCFAWVTVSQTYRVEDLLRSMLEELHGGSTSLVTEADLLRQIQDKLNGKRYLIVFDDVWDGSFWSNIGHVFSKDHDRGSRMVLTTRNEIVAKSLAREERVMLLAPLGEEDSWQLFCNRVFWKEPQRKCPNNLEDIARGVVRRCGGLPLAIAAAAGMLSTKERDPSDWKKSCKTLNMELSKDSQLGILMHSYRDLPSHLKQCFLYCSIFPEDYKFSSYQIIGLWVAEGFVEQESSMTLEETAGNYLQELIARSMIQVTGRTLRKDMFHCRIHDIFRMIAIKVSKERRFLQVLDHEQRDLSDVRRLSLQAKIDTIDSQFLRSLCWIDPWLKLPLLHCKLLKVLSLFGSNITAVPGEVFDLFNLRFLDLGCTKIKEEEFPDKIERLQQLQMLNLNKTKVIRLPRNIVKLLKLRHLILGDLSMHQAFESPSGIWDLKDLQTLGTIEASEDLVKNIGALTNLRDLRISKIKPGYTKDLLESLKKMEHLEHLRLYVNDGDRIDLESPDYSLPVQTLRINGRLESIPSWFEHSSNLRSLSLIDSEVREQESDPLVHLRSLPSLTFLLLNNAYRGSELSFPSNSFSNLQTLGILEMPELASIVTDKGALPVLHDLRIARCNSLTKPAPQVEYLEKLEKLQLFDLAQEVKQDFQEICSRCSNVKLTIY